MINAVSLHKAWVARTAGVFVLAVLAVVFFVAPAMGAQNNVRKPPLLTTVSGVSVKADFDGLVNGTPATLGTTFTADQFKVGTKAFKLTVTKVLPLSALIKGKWLEVTVINPVDKTPYAFLATVDTIDQSTGEVKVVIGQPGNPTTVTPAIVNQFEGKLMNLNYNKVPTTNGTNTIAFVPSPPGTGWNTN